MLCAICLCNVKYRYFVNHVGILTVVFIPPIREGWETGAYHGKAQFIGRILLCSPSPVKKARPKS